MSLVQMGDYCAAFLTEEVVGLAVTEEEGYVVLRIYLRNSEPIKIKGDEAEVKNLFNATVSDLCEGALVRKMDLRPPDSNPPISVPPTRLSVTMPNGTVVKYKHAADTFVEVIDKIGRRRVKNLDLKVNGTDLMSTSEDGQQRRKLGGHYINVGTSTKKKKNLLEEIDSRLNVGLKVEIIPKNEAN